MIRPPKPRKNFPIQMHILCCKAMYSGSILKFSRHTQNKHIKLIIFMHMSRTATKTLKICYVQVCKMTFSFKYPEWAYLKDIVHEHNSFQTGSTVVLTDASDNWRGKISIPDDSRSSIGQPSTSHYTGTIRKLIRIAIHVGWSTISNC